ncbi:MAG: tetratricopeptide repeat protein [Candidatus Obscuribacterales bacterium]|nr:tetratricopeptide repeat protein [Candidatus Obscuribacterales bacterium]
MGFLDFFNKKTTDKQTLTKTASRPPASRDELRKELFDCIDRNHLTEFETLCLENEGEILASFASWKKAPEEVQTDKQAMQKYAYCLMVVASHFQKQRNHSELMTMLTGIDDSEYSRKWQEQLGYCKSLMQEQLNFADAIPVLESCLELASGVSGAGVDKFLPLTLGFLGECYFQTGKMDRAAEYVDRAFQCTSMQGDYESSIAYLSNLFEIYRYAGESQKAVEIAESIANRAYERGELVTASNWRHQARALSKGEALHRVVLRIADEIFELDEIPKVKGERVEFIFSRNRMELVLCTQKCYEGRDLAQSGDYDGALKALEEAKLLDKYSPQAYYLSGAIKLASRRYAEAIAELEKVEELCPGFESSRSDLWLAKELLQNNMEHDACLAVFEANNDAIPVEERLKVCRQLCEKYPNFGEAYWRIGKMLVESERPVEAMQAFKAGAERAVEPDVRSRLVRDQAILETDEAEKKKLFEQAIAFEKANVLAQAMSVYLLRQLMPD